MRNPIVILAWVASVVLAWLVGANFGGKGDGNDGRSGADRVMVVEKERRPPRAADAHEPTVVAEKTRRAPAPRVEPTPAELQEPYTLDGVTTMEEASRRFMKFAARKLAAGPEGHLELLREIDRLTQNPDYQKLFDEATAMRLIYPWLKFVVEREEQVVAMTETIYKTAAEEPGWFEGLDDNTLEVFTEGVATVLPGAVGEDQLERFRGYVGKILAMPEDSLPKALKRNTSELRRNLKYWAAPVAPEDALAQLLDRNVSNSVKLKLLKRVDPKEIQAVDIVAILTPAIERGSWDAIQVLGRFALSAGDVVAFDRAFLQAAATGKVRGWAVRAYLAATNRKRWDAARPFVEDGLRRGESATNAFAEVLGWLPEHPPRAFVRRVLETHELDADTKANLRQRFQLD
ncbi:MAG: hypothetical protein ACYTDU_15195 [Planctomycetota bacterium]|jgi:hypothetical protein